MSTRFRQFMSNICDQTWQGLFWEVKNASVTFEELRHKKLQLSEIWTQVTCCENLTPRWDSTYLSGCSDGLYKEMIKCVSVMLTVCVCVCVCVTRLPWRLSWPPVVCTRAHGVVPTAVRFLARELPGRAACSRTHPLSQQAPPPRTKRPRHKISSCHRKTSQSPPTKVL